MIRISIVNVTVSQHTTMHFVWYIHYKLDCLIYEKYLLLIFMTMLMQYSFAQTFLVGAASRNINPDGDSLYMAGGNPNRPFIDVHDSLYAKAVYIGNNDQHIIILTFDCIGLMYPALLDIRDEIKKQCP